MKEVLATTVEIKGLMPFVMRERKQTLHYGGGGNERRKGGYRATLLVGRCYTRFKVLSAVELLCGMV